MNGLPSTVYPLPNLYPAYVPAPRFGHEKPGDDKEFRFEDYGLSAPDDFPRVSPSLWLPYFSGNSNTQSKPHSLVILA